MILSELKKSLLKFFVIGLLISKILRKVPCIDTINPIKRSWKVLNSKILLLKWRN